VRIRAHFRTGPGRKNRPGLRSYAWTRCATHRQPLVNEKSPCGVSTIVHNQSPTRRDGRVDPLGDGRMPLPLRVPPDSMTESEVARNLDEPKVATYVAKLDSICAAAQTRAKDEIQAIPRQNQAAVSEARDQVMRETIHTLRAAPSPRSVYWLMRDVRSCLWRSCSTNIRTWRSHRKNGCPSRSSGPRASTSASFLSDPAPLTSRTPK